MLALRQNLVARLDSQLAGVLAAASAPGGQIPSVGETTEDGFRLTGTVVVVAEGDQVRGAYLAAERPPMPISEVQQQRLLRIEPGAGPRRSTSLGSVPFARSR